MGQQRVAKPQGDDMHKRNSNKPNNQQRGPKPQNGNGGRRVNRGAAIRAQKRAQDDANKALLAYASAATADRKPRANNIVDDFNKLKITFLGGQEGIGEKNMQVIEWQNDAIIIDCGIDLSVNLPGVNYTISDTTYLESIRHKIKGYVVSHGHLDHLGGLKHVVPNFQAPIYGSRFTIGVIEKTFEDLAADTGQEFTPQTVVMNMDNHERLKLGEFIIELVRITHSVPESSCIVVDTPVGRIVNTGDWRLDPEPLDDMPTDAKRLKELGDEGILLAMSDSTGANFPGRTATEHTLQESFHDVIGNAPGRVFVAIFSSNMNRIQMIVNSAVASGRRVALDGRSMLSYAEIAVRQGILKIPKDTVLPMREMPNVPPNQVLIVCTGGQGEPNAALQRMAEGEHKHIKLQPMDTVIISSTPIPGNEISYQEIGDRLVDLGVHLYRQPTHEIDGAGPLHVSGHAKRDEYREMLHILRPKFFAPIYAGSLYRRYYAEMAVEEGWPRKDVIMAKNGDQLHLTADKWEIAGKVPYGSLLVDQNGSVVSNVVIKDRMMLANAGLVAVVLTIDKKSGQLLTSPDIISRGFIYMKDNEKLMGLFRSELRRVVQQRFKRVDLDSFKAELRDHVTHFLFENTQHSPIVIPVVNVVGGGGGGGGKNYAIQSFDERDPVEHKKPSENVEQQNQRFAELRQKLLKPNKESDQKG